MPKVILSHTDKLDMLEAINTLKHIGAITECKLTENQFISKTFLTPKPNGGKRFILNLKSLNKFITTEHFKMEDHRTACKLIPYGGYLATIDIKDAYFLLSVRQSDRRYLRFQFQPSDSNETITYEFNCMPFGLSVAPRVFTKIMREVMTYLRYHGYKSVYFLDDILCIADSYEQCTANVNETLKLLQCLGFVVNYDKSNLTPQTTCKYLGFIFDTENLSISLPSDKRSKIAQLVTKFSKIQSCTIRELAQLIGVLVAACPAAKYGWLYTKILEREKYLALLTTDNYEAKINLPRTILTDLDWWLANINTTSNFMRQPNYDVVIYTDASSSGWGAVCKNKQVSGRWKDTEQTKHINFLELMAVSLGLKSFANELTNCAILLRVDNTTAISYVNRMGGIQYPHLNDLARTIWQWCEQRGLWIFASYVNTKENRADAASRIVNPDTEWTISDSAFQDIERHFGKPKIDLFASRDNAKCPNFVSWKPDPDAVAVDAFTLNWSSNFFYAFPPFSFVLKCLRKIMDDKASGILVYPYWPSQPWFPLLNDLIISDVLYLNPDKYLLHSRFRDHHPLYHNLTLGVAKLCGTPLSDGAPVQTRQR